MRSQYIHFRPFSQDNDTSQRHSYIILSPLLSQTIMSDDNDINWLQVVTLYVCPSIGCLLSFLMFLSPVADLGRATRTGKIGHLPTLPWAVGLANCWGWTLYGYLTQNIFVMLSNVPGLFLSIHLNFGAIKLQYYSLWKEHHEINAVVNKKAEAGTLSTDYDSVGSNKPHDSSDAHSYSSLLSTKSTDSILEKSGMVNQERILYPLLLFWFLVSVYVGWFATQNDATAAAVGVTCNINLVFFYGVPIQILRQVVAQQDASIIHRPTLVMTACNAGFWMTYGLEIGNPVIWVPNSLGFSLGVAQVIALIVYPTRRTPTAKVVADQGQALLEAVVENLDESIYEPLTPRITRRKDLLEMEHPVEVLVPQEIRSAMIV